MYKACSAGKMSFCRHRYKDTAVHAFVHQKCSRRKVCMKPQAHNGQRLVSKLVNVSVSDTDLGGSSSNCSSSSGVCQGLLACSYSFCLLCQLLLGALLLLNCFTLLLLQLGKGLLVLLLSFGQLILKQQCKSQHRKRIKIKISTNPPPLTKITDTKCIAESAAGYPNLCFSCATVLVINTIMHVYTYNPWHADIEGQH